MCPAWGREEVSSHGPWRSWAQALAEAGYPCVRIDYPGEGDADGAPEDAAPLASWVKAAEVAARQLMAATGVTQIVFMGLRWGAVVAWRAALQVPHAVCVLAVAPVVRGRAHVRELSAMQAASSGDDEALSRLGAFQSGGFLLGPGVSEQWSAVDLAADTAVLPDDVRARLRQVVVLDREDLPAADKWISALAGQGMEVQASRLAGYDDIMADPHHAHLPDAWVEAGFAGLRQLPCADDAIPPADGDPQRPWAAESATLTWAPWRGDAAASAADWSALRGAQQEVTERFMRWSDTPALGVLTLPPGGVATSGDAFLLLNAGSTHHIGPSRLWVELARTWAAQGHAVLRLDLAGLGDAELRPGARLNETYPYAAVDDVRAVVAWLSAQPGVRRVTVGGLCAGGYHALAAARAGVPMHGILMINPLVYLDAEGMDLSRQADLGAHQVHSAMAGYRQAILNPAKWRKLLGGQANVAVLKRVLQRRLGSALQSAVRTVTRTVGLPLKGDLARVLQDVLSAGVQVQLVFAADDPGLPLLQHEVGSMLDRLQRRPQWHCTVLPQGDHVFTRWSDRQALLACLMSTLPRRG